MIKFLTILNMKYNKPFKTFTLKFQQISSKNTVFIIIKWGIFYFCSSFDYMYIINVIYNFVSQ